MKLQRFVNVNEKLNKNEDIFIYISINLSGNYHDFSCLPLKRVMMWKYTSLLD
jgi:hypothetical protein